MIPVLNGGRIPLVAYETRLNNAQAAVCDAASAYCWDPTPQGMTDLRNAVAEWRSSVGLWKLAAARIDEIVKENARDLYRGKRPKKLHDGTLAGYWGYWGRKGWPGETKAEREKRRKRSEGVGK